MDLNNKKNYNLQFLWRTLGLVKYFNNSEVIKDYCIDFNEFLRSLNYLSLVDENSSQSVLSTSNINKSNNEIDSNTNINTIIDPLFEFFLNQYNSKKDSIMLETCLGFAVKSGRSSLLLRVIYTCILSTDAESIRINHNILGDIKQYITKETFYSNDTLSLSSIESDKAEEIPIHAIASFGKADHGKLGLPDCQSHRVFPTIIDTLSHVEIVKVGSMSTYTIAVDSTGHVHIWGSG